MPLRPLRLAPLVLLALTLSACRNNQADTLRQQNGQLQTELGRLQQQVSDLQVKLNDTQTQLATTQAALTVAQAKAQGATTASSSGGADVAALRDELAWRQAQGYAVAVHAAFQGRMDEDPMYTPERLAGEVPDCLKADKIGNRAFGAPPRSVTACTVEPDGQNDITVTVKTAQKTFVNGVEGGQ